ncbi:MAG: hypothetical protein ACOCVH_01745 [Verrucomicrobiota bacterium]
MKNIKSTISAQTIRLLRLCTEACSSPILRKRPALLFFVIIFAISGSALTSSACTTPVWRYALEEWWPDPYYVNINIAGQLTASQQEAVSLLKSASEEGNALANMIIDVQTVTNSSLKTSVSVEYAGVLGMRKDKPFWSSELDLEAAGKVLDSPMRKKIAADLGSGEKVVWLALKSGDAGADKAAIEMVEKTLEVEIAAYEEYRQQANAYATNEWADAYTLPELGVSVYSIDRDDPEEEFFVSLLLGIDSALEPADKPIIYVIFGKGRCLQPLVGEYINKENILSHFSYLGGACSCIIKSDNPGFDLLLSVDWTEADYTEDLYVEDEMPELTGVMAGETESEDDEVNESVDGGATQSVDAAADETESVQEDDGGLDLVVVMAATLAVILILVAITSVLVARKGKLMRR